MAIKIAMYVFFPVCTHVRVQGTAKRIFIECNTGNFCEKLSSDVNFCLHPTKITVILHKDQRYWKKV
jgi:hypothetical protein